MDWFTHIFTAVAIAIALRSKRPTALALAFGAMAPDLDALFTPITILAPQLWFLDHRTFSHSLILGLPWALAVTWVIQRPALLALWRRLFRVDISLPLNRAIVLPMLAGVLLHILMDTLTVQGPALFAPISATRYQLDWFYFIDLAPVAVSAPLFVVGLWRLGTPRQRALGIAVLLVAVAATGTWRGITRAEVAGAHPGEAIIPTWTPEEWWTWRELPNGTVRASLVAAGDRSPRFVAYFPALQVNGSPQGLPGARAIAEATLDFTAFRMNTYAVALNASVDGSGTWRLGYFDPVRRAQAQYSGTENVFSPEDLVVRVAPDGSVDVRWP